MAASPKDISAHVDVTPKGEESLFSLVSRMKKSLSEQEKQIREGAKQRKTFSKDQLEAEEKLLKTTFEQIKAEAVRQSKGKAEDPKLAFEMAERVGDLEKRLEEVVSARAKYASVDRDATADAIADHLQLINEMDKEKTKWEMIGDSAKSIGSDAAGVWSSISSGSPVEALGKTASMMGSVGKKTRALGSQLKAYGAEMQAAGGVSGSFGKVISAAGGGLESLGSAAITALGPLAGVVAGVAAAIAVLGLAERAIRKWNKELLESVAASDLMGVAFTGATSTSVSSAYNLSDALYQIRSQLTDVRYMEEYRKGLDGLAKSGVSLPKIANQLGGLKSALEGARVYSELWGMDIGQVGEMMGDWSENLGKSIESVRDSFSTVNRDAMASGMSVKQFVGIIQKVSQNLGTMTSRVEEVSSALRGFKKSGMAAKDAEKAVMELTGALENMDQQQVRKLTASMIRSGSAQEVYNSAVEEGVAKVNAATKGMAGVPGAMASGTASIEDLKRVMNDPAAFDALPDAAKNQMSELKDTLGKDMSRMLDAEEIVKKAKLTTKIDLMIKHIPGLEKGFASLDKATDEQLNMMSRTYGVSLQTLQNMRTSVRNLRNSGKSDEEIKSILEEQQKDMEKQMQEDKANADRIAKAKTSSFAWLEKAGEAFMMIISEVLAAIADLGVFDILRAAVEYLVAVIKAALAPVQYLFSTLKEITGPLFDLGEEGSLLSTVLEWLKVAMENTGKMLKIALWPVIAVIKILGAIVRAIVKPFAKLFKGAKEGASFFGKLLDALQAVFDAIMGLIGPIVGLLSGEISFDEFMSAIGSALMNIVKKIGEYLLLALVELPKLLLKGLWALIKGLGKALYNLVLSPFVWLGKTLFGFFSNFYATLTKPVDFILGIFDKIQGWVRKIPIIGGLLSALIEVFKLPWKLLKAAFGYLQGLGKWLWNIITSPFKWLWKKIKGFFKWIANGWKSAIGWLADLPIIGRFFGGGGGGGGEKKQDEAAQDQSEAAQTQTEAAKTAEQKTEEQAARISDMTGVSKDEILARMKGAQAVEAAGKASEEAATKQEVAADTVEDAGQKALDSSKPAGFKDLLEGVGFDPFSVLKSSLPSVTKMFASLLPSPTTPMLDVVSMIPSLLGFGKGLPAPAPAGAEGATTANAGDVSSDNSTKTVNMTFNIGNGDPEAIAAVVRKVLYDEKLADGS